MISESSEVHALSKHSQNRSGKPKYTHANKPKRPTGSSSRNKSSQKGMCRNCGGAFPHEGDCPAKRKRCNFCKKLTTFPEYVGAALNQNLNKQIPYSKIKVRILIVIRNTVLKLTLVAKEPRGLTLILTLQAQTYQQ
ncbi:hypothetical protein HOLleu_03716 [Holothuria leucospilota]|uniref:Uncharacterized protein n=1 Tax=Holothuria leucospilota TaxID=206669 RepID=A0A9Q1HLZ0_HOLLE|nr:hypothetical protein HOLleu_03716 [Holothuria leucospilota]